MKFNCLHSIPFSVIAITYRDDERKPRFAASATAFDLTVAASWPAVGPSIRLLNPYTARLPLKGTSCTSRSPPDSNRVAVDEGTLR
jgi:hypothetical protein